MRKHHRPDWLQLSTSCMPCLHGQHVACRHHPDEGDRGSFSKAPEGTPCQCEAAGHPTSPVCCDGRMSPSGWSYRMCDHLAKTTRPTSEFGSTADVPYCGVHARGIDTRAANDARWRAQWDENDRRRDAERHASQASADWAERLTSEFGVVACSHHGGEALLVDVQPEHLYGLLVAAAGMLRDVGVEWTDVLAEVAG